MLNTVLCGKKLSSPLILGSGTIGERKENLIEAMEIAIASYNHKIKIARDCSKLHSVDFCNVCLKKVKSYYNMIKILKEE